MMTDDDKQTASALGDIASAINVLAFCVLLLAATQCGRG